MTDLQKYEAAMAKLRRRDRQRKIIAITVGVLVIAAVIIVWIFFG